MSTWWDLSLSVTTRLAHRARSSMFEEIILQAFTAMESIGEETFSREASRVIPHEGRETRLPCWSR